MLQGGKEPSIRLSPRDAKSVDDAKRPTTMTVIKGRNEVKMMTLNNQEITRLKGSLALGTQYVSAAQRGCMDNLTTSREEL